jgi:hypothetical protein
MAYGEGEMRKLDLTSRVTRVLGKGIREGHGFSRAEQGLGRGGFSR